MKAKRIKVTARMTLAKEGNRDKWSLFWPRRVQEASFAALTHDELIRFGLRELLDGRDGAIPVQVTIEEATKEPAEMASETLLAATPAK